MHDKETKTNEIIVAGSHAYLTEHYMGFCNMLFGCDQFATFNVIDVSTPSAPFQTGKIRIGDIPFTEIAIYGTNVFLKNEGYTILIEIDVSDPLNPRYVSKSEEISDITIRGSYLYATTYWFGNETRGFGFSVFDISTSKTPELVGQINIVDLDSNTMIFGSHITVYDSYAYVTMRIYSEIEDVSTYNFTAIDVSNPFHPIEVKNLNISHSMTEIVISGSYAYIRDNVNHGFTVIDLSVPSSPVQVGYLDLTNKIRDFAIVGSYIYVIGETTDLTVIDISTPASLEQVGSLYLLGQISDFAIVGSYLYATLGTAGFTTIDISTPSSPTQVGKVTAPIYAKVPTDFISMSIVDNYAYVAAGEWSLIVIDIRNPSNPIIVGKYYGGSLPFLESQTALLILGLGSLLFLIFILFLPKWKLKVVSTSQGSPPNPISLPFNQRPRWYKDGSIYGLLFLFLNLILFATILRAFGFIFALIAINLGISSRFRKGRASILAIIFGIIILTFDILAFTRVFGNWGLGLIFGISIIGILITLIILSKKFSLSRGTNPTPSNFIKMRN